MKKNKLFSFKRKTRKNKSEKESSTEKKVPKKRIRKLLIRIKEFLKKYPEQIKAIKKFSIIVTGYGFLINYALYFIFQIHFSFFNLFAWGIAYYFINDEFVEWFRRLIAKR